MGEISLLAFADKMNEIMPTIIKEFARRQINELYKGKITLPQFLILDFLQKQGEVKMTALANFMNVTTAAMTGIVDRLVRDHYVVRVFDPKDRRIIKIKPTAKGRELVKKVNQQRREMIIKIFGRLSQTDRQDYLRILLQILEILNKKESNI
ncbi:MAG: MarR family transcriptional regulator [Candidatus Omnitrophota bacterium]|nr:MarR family transcriptional regulator [Candidatus Omnitrophota bacterium]